MTQEPSNTTRNEAQVLLPRGTSTRQRLGKKGKPTGTGQGRAGYTIAALECCVDWLWRLHHVDAHRQLGAVGCLLTWLSRFRLRTNMDGGADGSTSRDHPFVLMVQPKAVPEPNRHANVKPATL